MTRYSLALILFSALSVVGHTQNDITGYWVNLDDADGKEKSIIEIYKAEDGSYEGRVAELLPAATLTHCSACPDERKDQPITNMVILWSLQPYKDYYSYGKIIDPKNGKIYDLNVSRDGDQLEVRGYIGVSMFGRSQYWKKTEYPRN